MKPAIIVHLKEKSQRLKNKNFKKLCGKPLYLHTFDKLSKQKKFFDIYIDSSSKIFAKESKKYGFNFIQRPLFLNLPNAQGNELLKNCLEHIPNKIIIELLVTNPFVKISSLNKAVNFLKKHSTYNSATPIRKIYNRFWYKNKEVNHTYNKLIGTQFLEPILVEAGFYCFKKESFLKEKSRIAKKNFFFEISEIESIDIDTKIDFQLAETQMTNMKKHNNV